MLIRQLTIRTRLATAFAILLVLLAAVSAVGLAAQQAEHQRLETYVTEVKTRVDLAAKVLNAANARAVAARNLLLVSEAPDQASERGQAEQSHAAVQDAHARLAKMLATSTSVSDEERQLHGQLVALEASYGPVALRIVGLAAAGKREEATREMVQSCRPLLAKLVAASQDYARWSETYEKALLQRSADSSAQTRGWLIGFGSLAIALSVALAVAITRSLTQPIEQAVRFASQVATGDLTGEVQATGRDEPAELLRALAAMQQGLHQIVGQVRLSCEHIATGSRDIEQGGQRLSERTEVQASGLQQTAAAMEEMTSAVTQSASVARQASELAGSATQAAQRSGAVVDEVVQTIGALLDSSRQIEAIVSTVEALAFQTNLLSLNAAVEAARAGEEGRGFAVVAGEVRALARRSGAAAREIKALIGSNVERVSVSAQLVNQAGSSMADVVARAQKVNQLIAEISTAASEQGGGIAQVNQAVADLDRATQQNAALVSESASSAASLAGQARTLGGLVQRFRLPA